MQDRDGSAESFTDKRRILVEETSGATPEGPGDKRLVPATPAAHVSAESLARGYEVQEVSLRPILYFLAALAVIAVIIHLVIFWLLDIWTPRALNVRVQVPPAEVTPATGPGPGIQAQSVLERAAEEAPALERINTYGWVDEEAGVVHIPIEQAMQLLVERSAPEAEEDVAPVFGFGPAYRFDSTGGQATEGVNAAE
ncbi:MAG: hypothetical protein DCC55_17615 [Chloroflexi bacterium]|nr:MAG: hypothetical protein DCC55_17615 [Chloroflexota bacterium]